MVQRRKLQVSPRRARTPPSLGRLPPLRGPASSSSSVLRGLMTVGVLLVLPLAVTAFSSTLLDNQLSISTDRSGTCKDSSSRTGLITSSYQRTSRSLGGLCPPPRSSRVVVRPIAFMATKARGRDQEEEYDDDEDLVRVPRRRGGGSNRQGSGREREYYDDEQPADASYRRPGRSTSIYDNEDDYDDDEGYDSDYEDDDEDYDDDDDDDDWDLRDIDTAALLENVVIPNPLLDSIDPDGAADRFPELARDPRFWFDMALFIAFLNFLSAVGPRDPYPDLPWF